MPQCTLPLIAKHTVDMIITDLAVFRFIEGQLTLTELMPGATLAEVQAKTEGDFAIQLTA